MGEKERQGSDGVWTHETKPIQDSLNNAGGVRGTAEGAHIAGNGYVALDSRIVIDNHVLVSILDTFLNSVCGFSKDGFPDLGVDGHQRRKQANLALGVLRARLCAPVHKLEHSCASAVAEDVQSGKWKRLEVRSMVMDCTHLRSRSLIPVTRFWVYWTISEKRKANADPDTSEMRVLLRFLSYMLGLDVEDLLLGGRGTEGREKRVEVDAGETWSRRECAIGSTAIPPSVMNVRVGPSAADIQGHLYTSFLQGSTADVAIRVQGSWDAIYNLHRVVLIQSVSTPLLRPSSSLLSYPSRDSSAPSSPPAFSNLPLDQNRY